MSQPPATGFFNKDASTSYDERNRQLAPISECMHFLIRLILRDLPAQSRVLCVGVGTGAEILSLSQAYPEWTFTGVDPSAAMLEVCRERLEAAGILHRCELVEGYIHDLTGSAQFDAALSILVAHFIPREDRLSYYGAIIRQLHPGAYFINTELSYDLSSKEFPAMLKGWEGVQTLMGATPEKLANLSHTLREVLSIISPEDTETLLRQSGISLPVRFYQALMISGWYGKRGM